MVDNTDLFNRLEQMRQSGILKPRAATSPQARGRDYYQKLIRSASANQPDYAAQRAASDWDPLWRPVEATINAITSAGVGVQNTIDKGVETFTSGDSKKIADYLLWSNPLGMAAAPVMKMFDKEGQYGLYGDYTDGFFASLAGDYESENYMTGSKLIENVTDNFGRAAKNGYDDVEDNVNPWVKGIAGFGLDVALDPLTYVPGGMIASGARGAKAALKAGGTLGSAVKGVVKGVDATGDAAKTAFKAGKFSGRPKPVGLEQWTQLRDYNKFEKIATKAGIPTKNLIRAASGEDPATIAKELNDILAKGGDYATRGAFTPEEIASAAASAEKYAPNAKTIFDGVWESSTGGRFQAAMQKQSQRFGVSDYLWSGKPLNGSDDWDFETLDAFGSGIDMPLRSNDTVGRTPFEVLGIKPTASYLDAKNAYTKLARQFHPDMPTGDVKAWNEISEAWRRLNIADNKDVIGTPEVGDLKELTGGVKRNPTRYPTLPTVAAGVVPTPNSVRNAIENLREFDASLGAPNAVQVTDDADEFFQRATNLDSFIEIANGTDTVASIKRELGIMPDESFSAFVFGADSVIPDVAFAPQTIYKYVRALADLEVEVPGYTDRARQVVDQVERLGENTPEAQSIINGLQSSYLAAAKEAGLLDDVVEESTLPDAAARMSDELDGDLDNPEAIANRIDSEQLTKLEDTQRELDLAEGATRATDEITAEPVDAGVSVGTGQRINIWGKVVDANDANLEISNALQQGVDRVVKAADGDFASIPALKGISAAERAAARSRAVTANLDNYGPGDVLNFRQPLGVVGSPTKAQAAIIRGLRNTNVPEELAELFDHITGFARRGVDDFSEWVDAIKAVALAETGISQSARELVQKLGLNDPDASLAKAADFYLKYLDKFETLDNPTAGVDLLGNVVIDTPGGAPVKRGSAALADKTEAAARAEAVAKDPRTLGAERTAVKANARLKTAQLQDEKLKVAAATERKRTGAPETDDPIHTHKTTGSWVSGQSLIKSVTKGSYGAHALNVVEYSNVVEGGLAAAIQQIRKTFAYKLRAYTVYEVKPLTGFNPKEAKAAAGFLSDPKVVSVVNDMLGDVMERLVYSTRIVKDAPVPYSHKVKTLRNLPRKKVLRELQRASAKGFKRNEPHGSYPGGYEPIDLKEVDELDSIHWANQEPISAILENAAIKMGIPLEQMFDAKPKLWTAMLLAAKSTGDATLRIDQEHLFNLLSKFTVRTGNSRKAMSAEVEAGIAEGLLTRTSGLVKREGIEVEYSGEIGVMRDPAGGAGMPVFKGTTVPEPEQVVGFATNVQRGLPAEPPVPFADDFPKLLANYGLDAREYPAAITKQIAQHLAKSTGAEAVAHLNNLSTPEQVFGFIRERAPHIPELLNNEEMARRARISAINNTTVRNGDAINEQMKLVRPDEALDARQQKAAQVYAKVQNKDELALVKKASLTGFQRALERMRTKGFNIYRQEASFTAYKTMRSVLATKFKRGTNEFWNAETLAMRELRMAEQEAGIFEVTALTSRGGKLAFKPSADHDWAYIGFLDVMDSITQVAGNKGLTTGLPEDVFRVAFDVLEVDGQTFPRTVLQEAAVLAMKLSTSGVKQPNMIASLNDYMIARIKGMKGYEGYAKSIDPAMTSDTAAITAMFSTALADERVLRFLEMRHLNNGAMAAAVADGDTVRILQPVLDGLFDISRNLFATGGEVADALDSAITKQRELLQQRGFGKGTLQAFIGAKKVETQIAESFTANEVNGTRMQSRMLRVADLPVEQQARAANAERADMAARSAASTAGIVSEHYAQKAIEAAGDPDAAKRLADEAAQAGSESVALNIENLGAIITQSSETRKAVDDLSPLVDEVPATTMDEAADLIAEAPGKQPKPFAPRKDGITLSSMADQGKWAKFRQMIYGGAGKEDLWSVAGSEHAAVQTSIYRHEKAIERVAEKWRAQIPVTRSNQILSSMLKANSAEARQALWNTFEAGEKEFAKEMWTASRHILDGSFLIRAGLSADWFNKFVIQGPLSSSGKAATLPSGLQGPDMVDKYAKTLARLVSKTPEEGGADWLTALKGMNFALHNAMLVPNIAADLSARVGHRAMGMTKAEAIANGWKKTTGEGQLAQFLDADQLYSPDDLRQLANLQNALEYNTRFNNKLILATDKVTSVIKSSLTLWNPAHHIVSAMGETFMNALAGVMSPKVYYQALEALAKAGDLKSPFTENTGKALNDFVRNIDINKLPASGKGIPIRIAGKSRVLPFETVVQALEERGFLINQNSVEDFMYQGGEIVEKSTAFSRAFSPIIKANRGLGEFAARRDNVFRLAHAFDIMQKNAYRSVDDLFDHVGREINSWHPTMQFLSPWEQKWARRAVFFYTWQRGALTKIFEAVAERPGAVIAPLKMNYEASTIGGEPEGFGHPMPNDPNLPDFAARNILGPHWYDAEGNVQSISFSAPQLDLIQQFFGALQYNPNMDLMANIGENAQMMYKENTIGMMAPVPKLAIESMTGVTMLGDQPRQIDNWPEHLVDQTGLGRVSKITGLNPLGGPRSDIESEDQQAERSQQLIKNMLTGLKWTNQSKYYDVAEQQRQDYQQQQLAELMKRLNQ